MTAREVWLKWLPAIVALALPVAAAQAATITIETVAVGNTSNTDDTHGAGYGAVGYAYNIGKYEVTAGQYRDFLNAVDPAGGNARGLYDSSMATVGCQITLNSGASNGAKYDFSGRPSGTEADWADRPVNFVSFWDAARFANWLHNGQGSGDTESGAYHNIGDQAAFGRNAGALYFIPTEDEWYKAAYHKNDGDTGNYFDYPTRSDFGNAPSNDLDGGGNNATFYDNGYTIGDPYYRTEVGAHPSSGSPYGTFDQGGNVSEWNETAIGSMRVERGASYFKGPGFLLASDRYGLDPAVNSLLVGFRVASSSAVPEPGSIAMLAGLAVMSLIWWRRRR